MSKFEKEYDIVIAGYGPTGATAANLLGGFGLNVLVVEPNTEIYDIPRAVHIDGETMRIFQSLGLAAEIEPKLGYPTSLRFLNGRHKIIFEQDISRLPQSNGWAADIFFRQPILESLLRKGADRYERVIVKLGYKLTNITQSSDGVNIEVTNDKTKNIEKVRAKYILGADGASSRVRNLVGIKLEDMDCDEPWLVVDWDLPDNVKINRDAYQVCDPTRPVSLIPCAGQHIRWEFMLNPDDDIHEIETEARVRELMAPHIHRINADLKPEDGTLTRHKVYSFHALLAETFQKDRVFLLGDAAHQMPPFLGQGLCAGIRDAYNLCWKLAGVLEGKYDQKIINSYTSERRPHVREVITQAVKIGMVIQTRDKIKAFARDSFLKLGRIFPPLVSFLEIGFSWRLGEGILAATNKSKLHKISGYPLEQPIVTLSNQPGQRLDEHLGQSFTLVGFGIDPTSLLESCTFDRKRIVIEALAIGIPDGFKIKKGSLTIWAETNNVELALVRPDRQIYGVCSSNQKQDISMQLQNLISSLSGQLS